MKHSGSTTRRILPLALAAAFLLLAGEAAAQSLLASRGLGLVVQPTDARARAMGGIGVGLQGEFITWDNPAAAAGIPAPGLTLAFQYDAFTSDFGGESAEGSTARFPLLMGAFPIGTRAAVTVGAAGFLDQNWAVQRRDTLRFAGDSVPVVDRFTSEGGVTQLRVGGAYRVLDGLALGLGADVYLGGVERGGGRFFPGEGRPGCCRAEWTYTGVGGQVGFQWSPSEALTVASSASFGGTLTAESDDTLSVDRSYDLPVRFSAGASGRVAGELLVGVGGHWGGWGTLDEALVDVGGARDVWSLGGGVEWDGFRVAGRTVPLRLGARQTGLPFRWGQRDDPVVWADERALTSGLGVVMAGGAVEIDLAGELGSRGGSEAGLDESFWRTTFSVTVLGR